MTEISKAWVWSQYKGVTGEEDAPSAPLPLFGNAANAAPTDVGGSPASKRTKWGASLAVAMIVGLFFPKIAFLLLIFSGLLILSGLEPKRFEDFFDSIPGGAVVLKILAISDTVLR